MKNKALIHKVFPKYRNQVETYYELIDAFLDFIRSVNIDTIPVSERYVFLMSSGLELIREDGIPMPWHHDLDIGVRTEVLVAARDQGFNGRSFGRKNIVFDVNPEVHRIRSKRSWMHHWGDEGGFSYKKTRLQIVDFKIHSDEGLVTRKDHDLNDFSFPLEWLLPIRKYKYLGFEVSGLSNYPDYLEWSYGKDWRKPLFQCNPKTNLWEKKRI